MPQTPQDKLFPPVPSIGDIQLYMPFRYTALSTFWLYFEVDPTVARGYVEKAPGLELALFAGKAVAALNFQRYASFLDRLVGAVNELEFNVCAYPKHLEPNVPELPLMDWLAGADTTKSIGQLRLHVPADDDVAVEAGKALFGEPKFKANFKYELPAQNGPGPGRLPLQAMSTWRVSVNESAQENSASIFELSGDARLLSGHIAGFPGNPSPLPKWAVLRNRTVQTSWNLFGSWTTYVFRVNDEVAPRLKFGTSTHRMRDDLQKLIGDRPPVAIQLFESAPAAAESRGFFIQPG